MRQGAHETEAFWSSSCVHSGADAAEEEDLPSLSTLDLLTWAFSYPASILFSEAGIFLFSHGSVHCAVQAAETGTCG